MYYFNTAELIIINDSSLLLKVQLNLIDLGLSISIRIGTSNLFSANKVENVAFRHEHFFNITYLKVSMLGSALV